MIKEFLFIFLLPPLLSQPFAQKELHSSVKIEEDYVPWSSDRKLNWEDFKADSPSKTEDAALTTTYVSFSYSKTGNKINYDIECKFQKSRSWGRVKTDYILKHEQGHFDIAEIFSRKLNKEIKEYLAKNRNHEGLNPIYSKLMSEKREMQEEYDSETNHSINKSKQAEWNEKIEEMLEELDPHGDY